MVIHSKETCIAYRCPYCTTGIKSLVGVFSLSGAMKKLKCDCGASELTIHHEKDGKIKVTVPCLFCGKEHSFTISEKLFFEKEIFVYPCPYAGIDIAFIGNEDAVSKALEESEKELLEIMKSAGIDGFDQFHGEMDTIDEEDAPLDPVIYDLVMFVIKDLMESGEISCCCDEGDYHVAVSDDHVKLFCRSCGASKDIPTDSEISARAFLDVPHIKLEKL